MNTFKTGVLLAAMGGLAVGVGAYFFGAGGAVAGLVISLLFQGASLFSGHKIALAFAKARPLAAGTLPWLEEAVAELSKRAGIPPPTIYISPDPQPNAFAAGRNPEVAVVCVNRGLLDAMRQDEVVAVLAHEIGHIRNRDTLTMTVVAAFATFISFLANIAWFLPRGNNEDRSLLGDLLVMLLAPVSATFIQLAVSRTREFAADREAAKLMGGPGAMIRALQALDRATATIPSQTAQTATAHMYVASPFKAGGLGSLFQTHPPIAARIAALRAS